MQTAGYLQLHGMSPEAGEDNHLSCTGRTGRMGRVLVPPRGLCVHPGGAQSDPAWESRALMRSECDEGLGTYAQCGAVAAGSGLSPSPR